MKLKHEKNTKSINIEEFKALANNLIPTTPEQAEWICNEVERLTQEHPELKEKFKEWNKMPESERKELEEIIQHILAEADRAHQKW
ncbi:MAG: hypothetical protein CW691_00910 [Candidatus Bathyarchaeum sp.]|nr:MAG: hypothetical protein CW691_00910 [Candidatus Bathyarchaeum sp.]